MTDKPIESVVVPESEAELGEDLGTLLMEEMQSE